MQSTEEGGDKAVTKATERFRERFFEITGERLSGSAVRQGMRAALGSQEVVVSEEMKALARFFAGAVDSDFPEGRGLDSDGSPVSEAADIADQLAKGDRPGALTLLADPGISEDHDQLRAALEAGSQGVDDTRIECDGCEQHRECVSAGEEVLCAECILARTVEHYRSQCDKPPSGWRCTREPGHDGPCAAVPDDPYYTINAPGPLTEDEQREIADLVRLAYERMRRKEHHAD